MKEGKVVNTRHIVFFTLLLTLGIVLSSFVKDSSVALIVLPSILGATFILSIIIAVTKKSFALLIAVISISIGFSIFLLDYTLTKPVDINVTTTVEGRIDYQKEGAIYLEDLKIDGKTYSGRAYIVTTAKDTEIGDFVYLEGNIFSIDYDCFDTADMSLINDNVKYKVNKVSKISVVGGSQLKLKEKVRNRLSASFEKVLNRDQQGVAESLIFGDKRYLDYQDNQEIKIASLSHIFAISGLHVGFLSAMVLWVLKRLKIKNILSLVAVDAILFIYMYLCGNSPSILRAIAMTSVVMLGKILKRRVDSLSCLSTAAAIILLTDPSMLFDLGFLMSVGAVGGLILFHSAFEPKLRKVFKLKFVSSSLSASFSSTLGILPALTDVFGSGSLYFALANFIVLPLVAVLYTLLMIGGIFSLMTPALSFLLYPAKYLIIAIMGIVRLISMLPYASITLNKMGIATIFYVLSLVVCSRFIILDKKKKAVIVCVFTLTAILSYILFTTITG